MVVDMLAYRLSLILQDDFDKIKSCIEFPRNKDNGDITFNTMKYMKYRALAQMEESLKFAYN